MRLGEPHQGSLPTSLGQAPSDSGLATASHTPVGGWQQDVPGLAPRALGEDRYGIYASRS